MLGRIIALIILLPVGLIVASVFFVVLSLSRAGGEALSGYGPGPFQSYGPYTAVAAPSAGSVGLVELVVVIFAIALLVLLVGFLATMLRRSLAPGQGHERFRDRFRERFDAGYGQSDTQLIQELHHIATRLEERIEVLETLMLERPGVTTKR
jgi:hypothetical protein